MWCSSCWWLLCQAGDGDSRCCHRCHPHFGCCVRAPQRTFCWGGILSVYRVLWGGASLPALRQVLGTAAAPAFDLSLPPTPKSPLTEDHVMPRLPILPGRRSCWCCLGEALSLSHARAGHRGPLGLFRDDLHKAWRCLSSRCWSWQQPPARPLLWCAAMLGLAVFESEVPRPRESWASSVVAYLRCWKPRVVKRRAVQLSPLLV